MKYQKRITCFLDILGFQTHIDRTLDKDGNDQQDEIERISSALNHIRYILDIDKKKDHKSKKITQFSDSIVISFSHKEESGVFWTLLELQWLIINLAFRGFLCRGGIAYGKLIHNKKLVFGPALVEAYKMESEAANYPRVILHDSIINIGASYRATHHTSETERELIKEILSQDSDGMYYIDYFAKAQSELDDPEYDYPMYLDELRKITESGINHKNPGVRVKYYWLKEKYNQVVQEFHREEINWDDPDVEQAYKSLPIL